MKTVVISAGDDKAAKLLMSLAERMGLQSFVLNDQKKEDIALIRAIDEGLKTEKFPLNTAYEVLDKMLGH